MYVRMYVCIVCVCIMISRGSVVSLAIRLRWGRGDGLWFESRLRKEIFLLKSSRLALGPTQPPIQLVLAVFMGGGVGKLAWD